MLIVLVGLAGSGKTELLHRLAATGEHVVDLEALAAHRGSAFGAFGQPAQPSHDGFQAAVRAALAVPAARTWVEDEGEYLGSVGLPPELNAALRVAPCVEVSAPRADRVRRIVATYGAAPAVDWLCALDSIATRLGPDRAARARSAVRAADLSRAVDVLLDYYDHGYEHRLAALARPVLASATADARLTSFLGAVHERT